MIRLYKQLQKQYPHVGHKWWPVSNKFTPKQLEIVVGALLTQNTNWRNVEKALDNLIRAQKLTAASIANMSLPTLQTLIKPSGFYKQKSKRLRALCDFIVNYDGNFYEDVTREQLLELNGIGRETADSILLYACNKPYFVIDAYTKRLLAREGYCEQDYDELRDMFEKKLPKSAKVYKHFHALIVENEKFMARRA
ncbi:MAG: endonuclease [Candidatus Aenigmatarchaeota archaeon]